MSSQSSGILSLFRKSVKSENALLEQEKELRRSLSVIEKTNSSEKKLLQALKAVQTNPLASPQSSYVLVPGKSAEEVLKEVRPVLADTFLALSDLFRRMRDNETLSLATLNAIFAVFSHKSWSFDVCERSHLIVLLQVVVQFLALNTDDESALFSGLVVLGELFDFERQFPFPGFYEVLEREQCIVTIMTCMIHHLDEPSVLDVCCLALCSLPLRSDLIVQLIADSGISVQVISALKSHLHHTNLVESAVGFLACLCRTVEVVGTRPVPHICMPPPHCVGDSHLRQLKYTNSYRETLFGKPSLYGTFRFAVWDRVGFVEPLRTNGVAVLAQLLGWQADQTREGYSTSVMTSLLECLVPLSLGKSSIEEFLATRAIYGLAQTLTRALTAGCEERFVVLCLRLILNLSGQIQLPLRRKAPTPRPMRRISLSPRSKSTVDLNARFNNSQTSSLPGVSETRSRPSDATALSSLSPTKHTNDLLLESLSRDGIIPVVAAASKSFPHSIEIQEWTIKCLSNLVVQYGDDTSLSLSDDDPKPTSTSSANPSNRSEGDDPVSTLQQQMIEWGVGVVEGLLESMWDNASVTSLAINFLVKLCASRSLNVTYLLSIEMDDLLLELLRHYTPPVQGTVLSPSQLAERRQHMRRLSSSSSLSSLVTSGGTSSSSSTMAPYSEPNAPSIVCAIFTCIRRFLDHMVETRAVGVISYIAFSFVLFFYLSLSSLLSRSRSLSLSLSLSVSLPPSFFTLLL